MVLAQPNHTSGISKRDYTKVSFLGIVENVKFYRHQDEFVETAVPLVSEPRDCANHN